jgi:flagellar hook-associated protein 3 FlgL
MRINTGAFYDSLARTVTRLQTELGDLTVRMSSGQRVSKPSDDPAASLTISHALTAIAAGAARRTLLETGIGVQTQVDSTLASISSTLLRAVEVATDAVQITNQTDTARATAAAEIEILAGTLLDFANTQYNGRYLFAGYQGDTEPVSGTASTATYVGDSNRPSVPLGAGRTCPTSVAGDELLNFGGAAGIAGVDDDVFAVMTALADDLKTNQLSGARDHVEQLRALADHAIGLRGSVGAWQNRLQANCDALEDTGARYEEVFTAQAGLDITAAITDYSAQEVTYQAALGVFNRIMSMPNLFDRMG